MQVINMTTYIPISKWKTGDHFYLIIIIFLRRAPAQPVGLRGRFYVDINEAPQYGWLRYCMPGIFMRLLNTVCKVPCVSCIVVGAHALALCVAWTLMKPPYRRAFPPI